MGRSPTSRKQPLLLPVTQLKLWLMEHWRSPSETESLWTFVLELVNEHCSLVAAPSCPLPHQSPKATVFSPSRLPPSPICDQRWQARQAVWRGGRKDSKEFTKCVISSVQELSIILDLPHSICVIYGGRDSSLCDRVEDWLPSHSILRKQTTSLSLLCMIQPENNVFWVKCCSPQKTQNSCFISCSEIPIVGATGLINLFTFGWQRYWRSKATNFLLVGIMRMSTCCNGLQDGKNEDPKGCISWSQRLSLLIWVNLQFPKLY